MYSLTLRLTIDGSITFILFAEWLVLYFMGFPTIFQIAVTTLSLIAYSNVSEFSLRCLVLLLLRVIPHVFFRDVEVRGKEKVPSPSPHTAVLFVAGPHCNQFIDPLVLFHVSDNPIRFLIAAKSMKRPEIRLFAEAMNSIPVLRPQDVATEGTGRIERVVDGMKVEGDNTNFIDELTVGCTLFFSGVTSTVKSIEGPRMLTLSSSIANEIQSISFPSKFKFSPQLKQEEVFLNVMESLNKGDYIGLFPEGASSDMATMLPFKAGFAIFSLGAMSLHPDLKVSIIPVGLNYFSGHRFRSRVYIDIGDPLIPSNELVEKYKAGGQSKKEALSFLVDEMRARLEGLTTSAPDRRTLELVWAVRRLYQPDGVSLTTAQKLELTRRLEEGREKLGGSEEVVKLMSEVGEYNDELKLYGVSDFELSTNKFSADLKKPKNISVLLGRVLMLAIISTMAIPGIILNSPILLAARYVSSRKADEVKKTSLIKEGGMDVVASWKLLISLALIPLCFILYPMLAVYVGGILGVQAIDAWSYCVVLQLPLMFGSVVFIEKGRKTFNSISPLIHRIVENQNELEHLRDKRVKLKGRVLEVVNKLGRQLMGENFEKWRMLNKDTTKTARVEGEGEAKKG